MNEILQQNVNIGKEKLILKFEGGKYSRLKNKHLS